MYQPQPPDGLRRVPCRELSRVLALKKKNFPEFSLIVYQISLDNPKTQQSKPVSISESTIFERTSRLSNLESRCVFLSPEPLAFGDPFFRFPLPFSHANMRSGFSRALIPARTAVRSLLPEISHVVSFLFCDRRGKGFCTI
jgi:hypothetical protein